MKQDEIVAIIREAAGTDMPDHVKGVLILHTSDIDALIKLVAAKEREACAKVCEDNATDLSEGDWDSACINCADHIRYRGEA